MSETNHTGPFDVLALKRHSADMASSKRATIYLDAQLHRALRLKAAETDQSVSELVNMAVQRSLAEDAQDLAVFEARALEPTLPFEQVLKDLKRRAKL